MAALLALARACDVFPGDEWALLELRQWRTGWLDGAVITLDEPFGGNLVLAIALALALAIGLIRLGWTYVLLIASTPFVSLFSLALKDLAARPRPDAALALVEVAGYGFPSGHAVFAVTFLGALIYALNGIGWPDDNRRWRHCLQRTAQGALALLILAVGVSRVYLGVHWPSDVIGGFLFGGLCLAALVAAHGLVRKRP